MLAEASTTEDAVLDDSEHAGRGRVEPRHLGVETALGGDEALVHAGGPLGGSLSFDFLRDKRVVILLGYQIERPGHCVARFQHGDNGRLG